MQQKIIHAGFGFLCFCASLDVLGATIYKCQSTDGQLLYQKSPCQGGKDTVGSWEPKEKKRPVADPSSEKTDSSNPPVELSLKQNSAGHYNTDGSVNDKTINFVVDTGASFVALPESIAHSAMIYCDDKIRMETANGAVDSCTAKIKKLTFGPFQIKEVMAVLQPNLNQPLLGMNVLQMFKIEQKAGEMKISILEEPKEADKPKTDNPI